MPSYKLYYFNGRGRAELARLVFAHAGVKYEDVRVKTEEWPALKPKTPFGQLPCLEVDGQMFAQSVPIAAYLATEFGLHGKDNLESLKINQVVGLMADMVAVCVKVFTEKDEATKAELFKQMSDEEYPRTLGLFEKLLVESGTGFFVGDKVTLADLGVFYLIDCRPVDNPQLLDPYPELRDNVAKVKGIPNIKAWLDKRPVTDF